MKALRNVYGETLIALAQKNPSLVVVDPDVGNSTKADLFGDALPDRYFSVGIAEQNAVGMAAGLANTGFVPWLSTFSPFLSHRAVDQIRIMVAQSRTNVKLAGAYTGLLTGATGRTHQDVSDIAVIRSMPDMTLISPADEHELVAAMDWAQNYVGPVYFRITRDPEESIFGPDYTFTPGAVHTVRPGTDAVYVATGVQTVRCVQAATALDAEGLSVGVVHVPSLKPVDEDALMDALSGVDEVISVEEHTVIGGLGGLVAETMTSRASGARLTRWGLDDIWTESAPNDFLLDKYGLSSSKVASRTIELLRSR